MMRIKSGILVSHHADSNKEAESGLVSALSSLRYLSGSRQSVPAPQLSVMVLYTNAQSLCGEIYQLTLNLAA